MSLTPPQDVFGVVAEKPAHKLAGFESPPTVVGTCFKSIISLE